MSVERLSQFNFIYKTENNTTYQRKTSLKLWNLMIYRPENNSEWDVGNKREQNFTIIHWEFSRLNEDTVLLQGKTDGQSFRVDKARKPMSCKSIPFCYSNRVLKVWMYPSSSTLPFWEVGRGLSEMFTCYILALGSGSFYLTVAMVATALPPVPHGHFLCPLYGEASSSSCPSRPVHGEARDGRRRNKLSS